MTLGIDVTYTPSGGSLSQIKQILLNLSRYDEVDRVIVYTKESNLSLFESVRHKDIRIYSSRICDIGVLVRVLWEQAVLPWLTKKHGVDVLFCPGNIAPVFGSGRIVQWIGTIGPFWDEFYSLDVALIKKIRFRVNRLLMVWSARRANRVIFESEYSRRLLVSEFGVRQERTEVIQIGKDKFFYRNTTDEPRITVCESVIPRPFLLCVSHLYEYKNYIRLIKAFSIVNKTCQETVLVIAGNIIDKKYFGDIMRTVHELGLEDSVIYLGLVGKEDLRILYSNCTTFVFPSPVENFGYTLMEAMGCGAPIVTSNTTSMPESCGEAALYFDPKDVYGMAEKIKRVVTDMNIRRALSRASLERIEHFPDYTEVNEQTAQIITELARSENR